ncbi:MAG: AraC family transcriptional regulator ligand-binding domain-containing protein [Myxococcota bacterium]
MDAPFRTDDAKLTRAGTRSGFATAVVLFGLAKGVPREEMERATGLRLADLVDADARVPDSVLGAAWRAIGARFADPMIALEMAAAAPAGALGPLAQAVEYSATRRDALETIVRYQKVLSGGLDVRLRDDGERVSMVFSHSQDLVDEGLGAEAALGLTARMGREVLGLDGAIERIEFAHPIREALPHDAYETWFGAPVRFAVGRNAVVFERAALLEPLQRPDAEMYGYISAHLDLVQAGLLERIADAPLDRVREAIAAQARRSRYGAEDVAQALGMSVRTLQRHTQKHGASLRALLDEAREASATKLLADPRLSIEEVAFVVGYSDDRAFRRAFQRWTGKSPAAFRKRLGEPSQLSEL